MLCSVYAPFAITDDLVDDADMAVHPDKVDTVVAIMLEQPRVATDLKLLCRASRVCSSWREAVTNSTAAALDVAISFERPERSKEALMNQWGFFALGWLPRNGHLVRSISLVSRSSKTDPDRDARLHLADVIVSACVNCLTRAAAGPAVGVHGRPRGLRKLCSFSSDAVSSPLVAALPTTLTALQLDLGQASYESSRDVLAVVAAQLPKLRDLKHLCIKGYVANPEVCLELGPLARLRHLTHLELQSRATDDEWQHLQEALLQMSDLQVPALELDTMGPISAAAHCLNMAALSSLTELTATLDASFNGTRTVLPTQLRRLELLLHSHLALAVNMPSPISRMNLGCLEALQQLSLQFKDNCIADFTGLSEDLVDTLPDMSHLTLLSISYDNILAAVDDVQLWRTLPRLHSLVLRAELESDDDTDYVTQLLRGAIFPGLAACTMLTRLEVVAAAHSYYEPCDVFGPGVGQEICGLSALTSLQHLAIDLQVVEVQPWSPEHLTTLSKLSHLQLSHMGTTVADESVLALAAQLTQLRHLDLSHCGIKMPSTATALQFGLRHLRRLQLEGNPGVKAAEDHKEAGSAQVTPARVS